MWEASTSRGPQGGPQPGWGGGPGELSAQRHLPLELFSPPPSQVSLRGCQGFTCWRRSSSFLMKGQAGGVFVARTAGRGRGPNGETPIEERSQTAVCQGTEAQLSYFMRKKTNKQTKRSKEKGRKVSTETILRSPRRPTPPAGQWDTRLCSSGRSEAYLDQKKTKPPTE